MEGWQTVLVSGATCLITLIVTYIFNGITNRPAKKKEEQKKFQEEISTQIKELTQYIDTKISNIDEAGTKNRDAILQDVKKEIVDIKNQLKKVEDANVSQNTALQNLLRNELKLIYSKWQEKGYAPRDAKHDTEELYKCYHSLGANGVIDVERDKFLKLPDAKPVSPRAKNKREEK